VMERAIEGVPLVPDPFVGEGEGHGMYPISLIWSSSLAMTAMA